MVGLENRKYRSKLGQRFEILENLYKKPEGIILSQICIKTNSNHDATKERVGELDKMGLIQQAKMINHEDNSGRTRKYMLVCKITEKGIQVLKKLEEVNQLFDIVGGISY